MFILKNLKIEAKRTGSLVILYLKSRKKRTFIFFKREAKTKVFDNELSKFCHSYSQLEIALRKYNRVSHHVTLENHILATLTGYKLQINFSLNRQQQKTIVIQNTVSGINKPTGVNN